MTTAEQLRQLARRVTGVYGDDTALLFRAADELEESLTKAYTYDKFCQLRTLQLLALQEKLDNKSRAQED